MRCRPADDEQKGVARRGARATCLILVACFAASLLPAPASAQVTSVLEGQIVDAASGAPLTNALVSLDDDRAVLSGANGEFRFPDVAAGAHSLSVTAFGYMELVTRLVVSDDVLLTVPLQPEPLRLDSITVEARTLDFDGRVTDPRLDVNLYDAQVRSSQGHVDRTGWHGRFDLDDVYQDVPLRLLIQAFGYMPLDTTLIPDDEGRHTFGLGPDPVGQKMIALQVQRLEERAADDSYSYRPSRYEPVVLDRSAMARFMSRGTLQTLLAATYTLTVLRRVACVLIDERPIATGRSAGSCSSRRCPRSWSASSCSSSQG